MLDRARRWGSSLAFVIALAGLLTGFGAKSASAAKLDDLVGQWSVLLLIPESPQLADMKAERNGDKLKAVLNSALGENKIDDISLEGDEFVLTYLLKLGDTPMDIQVTARIEGDLLKGTVLVGGGAMNLQLRGARAGTDADKALKADYEKILAAASAAMPTLAINDARGFTGDWVLSLVPAQSGSQSGSQNGSKQNVDFSIKAINGMAVASLVLPPPFGPLTINKISKEEKGGLKLEYDIKLGNAAIVATMNLQKEGDGVKGKLGDAAGIFARDFTGMTKKKADAAGIKTVAATTSPASSPTGAGAGAKAASPGAGERPGEKRGSSVITLGGNNVRITYGIPSIKDPADEWQKITQDGTVWRMGKDAATKLRTDADLKFGDKVIKSGSYSLWAKRVGKAWHLTFNSKADVWSTEHDLAADVATIALETKPLAQESELLKIELLQAGTGGTFKMSWGKEESSVNFTLAK